MSCCAYALIHLAMDVPFFPFILRRLRRQVDVPEGKDHLDTNVPEFFLQVNKDKVLISTLPIKPFDVSPLLRRAKSPWFSLYHWVTA